MTEVVQVLLADDEKEFVETLAARLEVRGMEVHTALSGDEALSRIKENRIDVVILDVLMPGRDGIQTLKEIKEINPLLQVLMLTGHGTIQTGIEGMKLGAYDFLIKPTDTLDLVEKIEGAYRLKSGHEERIRQAEIKSILKRKGW